MTDYKPQALDKKWQQQWTASKAFEADVDPSRVADFNERVSSRHQRFALADAFQDDAVDRGDHRDGAAAGGRSIESSLGRLELGFRPAHGELGGLQRFIGRPHRCLGRIHIVARDRAGLGERRLVGERGLGDPRDALDEDMPARDEAGEDRSLTQVKKSSSFATTLYPDASVEIDPATPGAEVYTRYPHPDIKVVGTAKYFLHREHLASVRMVTDISGSMNATDVEPNRITAAVRSAKRLTDELPETFRLGLVTFSDFAEQRAAPSTDRSAVLGALDRLTAVGGTAMGLGLERGLEAAMTPVANEDGTGTRRLPAVLVLLSDGKDTQGGVGPIEVAEKARRAGIPIYAIALGTPDGEVEVQDSFGLTTRIQVPPDTETLKEIAKVSRGRFYEAADSAKLEEIYAGLGTRLSSKQVKEEVTVAFAGGALLLLLLGSGLSMAWFGRPV